MFHVWVVWKGQERAGKLHLTHSAPYPEWQVALELTNLLCDLGQSPCPLTPSESGQGALEIAVLVVAVGAVRGCPAPVTLQG